MLVLSRKAGQRIMVCGDVVITVVSIPGDRVRIGVEAPREVRVDREEVFLDRQERGERAGIRAL